MAEVAAAPPTKAFIGPRPRVGAATEYLGRRLFVLGLAGPALSVSPIGSERAARVCARVCAPVRPPRPPRSAGRLLPAATEWVSAPTRTRGDVCSTIPGRAATLGCSREIPKRAGPRDWDLHRSGLRPELRAACSMRFLGSKSLDS